MQLKAFLEADLNDAKSEALHIFVGFIKNSDSNFIENSFKKLILRAVWVNFWTKEWLGVLT